MMNESPRYPRRIRSANAEFELRLMSGGDAAAALAFAATLPPHVGEMRIVVSESARGAGLGRLLAQDASSY